MTAEVDEALWQLKGNTFLRGQRSCSNCGPLLLRYHLSDSAIEPFWTAALAVLRQGPFRRYIIGSALSDTGTWMQVMAQGWVMSALTDKALMLGMVNFAAGIPTLALTMIGGSAADRYDKRMILIATQVVQIATAITLGLLVMTEEFRLDVVLPQQSSLCIAFEIRPLRALPELVKKEEIARRSRDLRISGSRLVGPPGRIICGVVGTSSAFFFPMRFLRRGSALFRAT